MMRGSILLTAGIQDVPSRRDIFAAFLNVCGGSRARLVVFATASLYECEAREQVSLLEELGAGSVRLVHIEKRRDGENAENLALLEQADGVLLIACNHLRLTTNLGGTSLAKQIRRRNATGLHVAGLAAGAAYLCAHMITYGDAGLTPRAGRVTLTPGLGLLNSVIFDGQVQRQGLGRLMTAMAYNPFAIGLGLEEHGAVLIDAGYKMSVLGTGVVSILDPSELEHSSIDEAGNDEPVCMVGMKYHVMIPGTSFHLKSREADIRPDAPPRRPERKALFIE